MKNAIMVDLESIGTTPGSAIVALGAVRFDLGGLKEEFYQRIDLPSCITSGLTMDASTFLWWLKQEDAARLEITLPGRHLRDVLGDFEVFIGDAIAQRHAEIWGNGANFDNALLGAAYRAIGERAPWQFWNDRCYRTMKALRPDIALERSGTHHNALDDAKSQAEHLIRILNAGGAR